MCPCRFGRSSSDTNFFGMDPVGQLACVTTIKAPLTPEDFSSGAHGIPTEPTPPLNLPAALKTHGLLWKSLGEREPILKFGLRNKLALVVDDLKRVLAAVGVRRRGKVSLHNLYSALIGHLFADLPPGTRASMVAGCVAACKRSSIKVQEDPTILDAVEEMDEENREDFKEMSKIIKRKYFVAESLGPTKLCKG